MRGKDGHRVQVDRQGLGSGGTSAKEQRTIWESNLAWPGLQCSGDARNPDCCELSQFLRAGQILENNLGSRKTGLDSAHGICHSRPFLTAAHRL